MVWPRSSGWSSEYLITKYMYVLSTYVTIFLIILVPNSNIWMDGTEAGRKEPAPQPTLRSDSCEGLARGSCHPGPGRNLESASIGNPKWPELAAAAPTGSYQSGHVFKALSRAIPYRSFIIKRRDVSNTLSLRVINVPELGWLRNAEML